MSQQRELLEQRLLQAYRAYYDVEVLDQGELRARCDYHSRQSQYVLVKKAELWAAESHEYLYLYSVPRLTARRVEEIFQAVLDDGTPRVKPHAEHMCTHLTALVLYDQADPEALEGLKKLKKRREFKLSLHGWMEFRIAAVDAVSGEIATNRSARDMSKALQPFVDSVAKSKL